MDDIPMHCVLCGKDAPRPVLVDMKYIGSSAQMLPAKHHVYCSASCLSAHPQASKSDIENRISRAAEILQGTFYIWRELMFDVKVKKVELRGDEVHVFEDVYLENSGCGPFYDFPAEAISGSKHKAALLSAWACTDAIAYLYELSQTLLWNLASIKEEASLNLYDSHVKVRRYRSVDGHTYKQDIRTYQHDIIVIETSSKKSFAIDPAGAQFGQYEAVLPLDVYLQTFGENVVDVTACGNARGRIIDFCKNDPMDSTDQANEDLRVPRIQLEMHKSLLTSITEFEAEHDLKLCHTLHFDNLRYKEMQRMFFAHVRQSLKQAIESWRKEGCHIPQHATKDKSLLSSVLRPDAWTASGEAIWEQLESSSRIAQVWYREQVMRLCTQGPPPIKYVNLATGQTSLH